MEENTKFYLLMEYCGGGSLDSHIKAITSKKRWFSERDVSKILKSVLKGLHYLHSKNLVHRDIKTGTNYLK